MLAKTQLPRPKESDSGSSGSGSRSLKGRGPDGDTQPLFSKSAGPSVLSLGRREAIAGMESSPESLACCVGVQHLHAIGRVAAFCTLASPGEPWASLCVAPFPARWALERSRDRSEGDSGQMR